MGQVRTIVEDATKKARKDPASNARFSLFDTATDEVVATLRADLGDMSFTVEHRSVEELLVTFPGRRFVGDEAAFRAADRLVVALALDAAEPEVFYTAMPVDQTDALEGVDAFPGCWVDPEDGLNARWALDAIRAPQAWAFAEARGRPARGEGVVVAQPDTGITRHPELAGITLVAPRNLLGGKPDNPTDPLPKHGNPGHGTSTASVVASPESLHVSGSAPAARLMPIRAIESVVRLSQIKVAQAMDHAVNNGAHVITMSLGGIASLSLWMALSRAVDAGVIVMAAAGNCVGTVVWPARYEKCIGVAGVDRSDRRWIGSCSGPEVDFAAPGQNVYRAAAADMSVGQGQGTSYAVALVAGVAACWLAFHGRSNVVAAAKARGETVQDMFRRIAKATARVPAGGWDAFNMGAGVIDAEALLKAGFDHGLGTESPTDPAMTAAPATSVRSLALARTGPEALRADFDWHRHSAEISLALLRDGKLPALPAKAKPETPAAPQATLMEADGTEGLSAPAIRRARAGLPKSERRKRVSSIIAARAGAGEGGVLESGNVGGGQPLTRHGADATIDRVMSLAKCMPAREIPDKAAFVAALRLLQTHGSGALKKLVEDPDAEATMTPDDEGVLEAIVIADGSRPSFLVEDNQPPATHPFMLNWSDEVARARPKLAPVCAAIGRIQPEFGHNRKYIGTGSLVDADKGVILTNYHVMDDARARHGVLMEEKNSTIRIHGQLEIDFVGEASRLEGNRFRIVEAYLPRRAGRGFGHLDAVTMRIEPINGATMPQTLKFDAQGQTFQQAQSTTLCTIGFPGPPKREQSPRQDIDWTFVIETLFGNLFGVKRLAPGRTLETFGAVQKDPLNITFGHEATSFGGASGSPMIAWEGSDMVGFGLHFSGFTGTSNYSIGMYKVASELRAVGVPI